MNNKICICILLLVISLSTLAQGNSPGVQLANHIADKMRDSLQLNVPERNRVFAVNMYIYNKKMIIRQQVSQPELLRGRLQNEEHKRDSMYQVILPPEKFQMYLQKKVNLVSSN
jgi:hypothetical protein